MTDELTAEELRQAVNGAADRTCPECGREFPTIQSMRGHLASHKRKPGAPPAPPKDEPRPNPPSLSQLLDAAGRETVRKAVKNAKTTGHIVAFAAPHLGLAIAGQEAGKAGDQDPGKLYVRSRAEMAGELVLEIRDPEVLRQVLRVLAAFNSLFELTKGGELIGGLAVAGMVDARVVPPDFKLRMGPVELPVAEAMIGDVVAEWERRGLYQAAGQSPPPDGGEHPPWPPTGGQPGPEVVPGGVENT